MPTTIQTPAPTPPAKRIPVLGFRPSHITTGANNA